MNTHDQVEPLLAEHALGTLAPDARELVEAHLATCASCRLELDELAAAVAQLEQDVAVPFPDVPPAELDQSRQSLLDAARRAPQRGAGAAAAHAPTRQRSRRRRFVPSPSGIAAGALAAACVVLVAVTVDRQDRINSLEGRLKKSRGDQVEVLRGASVKDLDTGGAFGDARAQVVLRRDAGVVAFRDVPAPADGMVWQVWAISGERIDSLGIIDDARSSAFLALGEVDPDEVERIIVTLEPEGGSDSPAAEEVAEATV